MGLSNSCCCSGSFCTDEKLLASIHSETEKPFIDLSHSEIEEKLANAQELVLSHFQSFSLLANSETPQVQIEETSKGHLVKVFFVLPCPVVDFSSFLDLQNRNSWDNLIEFSKVLEKTRSFSLIHLKYKSQLSYSSKELILASVKNMTDGEVFTVFTSVPNDKIGKSDQVEIFEGGYKAGPGQDLKLVIHLNIGSRSLSTLFQKLTEKMILDMISRLTVQLVSLSKNED